MTMNMNLDEFDEDERFSEVHLLLLGGGLLGGGLLGSGLLGGGLLGSGLLSCGLLGGLLGSRLLGGLLSGRLLGGLLSSGLLGLLGGGLLGLGLLLGLGGDGKLEASSSLLSGGTASNNLLGGDHLLECEPDADLSLGGIGDLVVGHDVLKDGLAGGTVPFLQGLDGGGDHGGEGRVGGGDLGLGGLLDLRGGGSRHDVCVGVGAIRESPC